MFIDSSLAADVGPESGHTLRCLALVGGLCLACLSPWLLLLSRGSPAAIR